jgi:uncharacterized repeat protein (TIGR01451 family)
MSYLLRGGHLLVSGQDVAYWDGGGSPFSLPSAYFTSHLGLEFSDEGNLAKLDGVPRTPFAGLSLAINTPDSAGQQTTPDAATIKDRLLARPALRWPEGAIGGATAGACRPWRGAWFGFGLEGTGPRAARADALGRLLDWFMAPPTPYGLVSAVESRPAGAIGGAPLIGLPGTAVSQTIRLDNVGAKPDTVDLQVDGGPWPIDIELPDGRHVDAGTQFTMDGCSGGKVVVTVSIPPDQPRDAGSAHELRFVSQGALAQGDPTAAAASTVTVKTPAPILFVDDERWYNHHEAYTSTLEALDLSYDLFNTQDGGVSPSADTLQRYPLLVWTTGYDWYTPLSEDDEAHLSTYLDEGGRLLFTSQDTLDVRGESDFVRSRLGVAEASLSVTGTEVIALPGSPLGADLGPWRLLYPFPDWSDAVVPTQQARATLQNERLFTVGIVRPAPNWRTAFFSFPLETLADSARATLLGRTMVWLSPLGESKLEAPPVAGEGSRIPITLTLGLATDAPRTGLRAVVPLSSEMNVVPGSLRGPWNYDATEHLLAWSGDLSPEQRVTLGADLDLAAGIPDGSTLPLRARLFAGDGIAVTAEAPIHIDSPWLELREQAEPAQPSPQGTVVYTFTVTNAGVAPTTGQLTHTLPSGLKPLASTAWSSNGEAALDAQGLTWSGTAAPGSITTIGYRARVTLRHPGVRLIDRAELSDEFGRRVVAWAVLSVPTQLYVPLVHRGAP